MPQLHNYHTQGRSWKEHGITAERVLTRNIDISYGSETLWEWTQTLIQQADDEGMFPEEE
jgi:putative hydrolase of HD superfamily